MQILGIQIEGDPMSVRAGIRRRITQWLAPPARPAIRESDIVVCECNAWPQYIMPAMYPKARRITITPGERVTRLLDRLPPTTRAVVLQIDASTTCDFWGDNPLTSAMLAERGIAAVDVDAVDIRKRTVHEHAARLGLPSAVATRAGAPDERVMIKTTLNAGGAPERKLLRQYGKRSPQLGADISATVRGPLDYRVCRRADVPDDVWTDPTLVVERFIENAEGLLLRVYLMGPASVVSLVWAPGAIKKLSLPLAARQDYYCWDSDGTDMAIGQSHALVYQAMKIVRPLCQSLRVEFGAVDCVVSPSGDVTPVDINKTPGWGHRSGSPIIAHLRHGMEFLLPPDRS